MNKNLNKLVKNLTLKESDYYLISTFDEYLYEYVPECNMRLKFLTNFFKSFCYFKFFFEIIFF